MCKELIYKYKTRNILSLIMLVSSGRIEVQQAKQRKAKEIKRKKRKEKKCKGEKQTKIKENKGNLILIPSTSIPRHCVIKKID